MTKTDLDPTQRAGLLTQGSFLALTGNADGSNPVRRGKFVYTKLLCHTLPPPPANVPPPAPASAGGTTRQRFDGARSERVREGLPHVDGSHRVRLRELRRHRPVPHDGQRLARRRHRARSRSTARRRPSTTPSGSWACSRRAREVRTCFAGEWSRFALSRADTDADAASLQATAAAFASDTASVQDLMAAVATMRSFRYRSPSPGEMP